MPKKLEWPLPTPRGHPLAKCFMYRTSPHLGATVVAAAFSHRINFQSQNPLRPDNRMKQFSFSIFDFHSHSEERCEEDNDCPLGQLRG